MYTESFVKIKTLQLIIATLQSELRTESSKYRLCIMDQAFADIEALTTYTCEPDPKYGDKPAEQVRKGAGRAVEMLTRNLKAVSNTGVVKISSRTLPLTIRVARRLADLVRHVFTLSFSHDLFSHDLFCTFDAAWLWP
eukprot:COSAG04_NODE_1047_length_8562_cov_9.403167_2_plen_138_part_00